MIVFASVNVAFPLSLHVAHPGIDKFPIMRRANDLVSMSASSHMMCTSMSGPSPFLSSTDAKPSTQLYQSWIQTAIEQHGYVVPPHAGSLFTCRRPRAPFLGGWYLRLTLPSTADSYSFMFSGEADGPGTAQLLPPDDVLHMCELSPSCERFYGEQDRLSIGHWGYASTSPVPRGRCPAPLLTLQCYRATS